MRHSTENIRHFQWDAQQVQTYVSQAMAALTQDARTSRAFDTFDERKEAVRDVLKFTRCPLFGTWFATYSLLNDNTNKWRDWFPALVALCPEGLLTRVTLEHERAFPKDVGATHATQDVTAAVTPTRNGNGDSSGMRSRRREIFCFSPSGTLIGIASGESDVDDEPVVPQIQA